MKKRTISWTLQLTSENGLVKIRSCSRPVAELYTAESRPNMYEQELHSASEKTPGGMIDHIANLKWKRGAG